MAAFGSWKREPQPQNAMSHGPGTVEHWQQWWYHNHTEEQHARELATGAEQAAGPSYMNPEGPVGRRGRPAYGGSAFPSDFTGVAATSTAELPSIFPKRAEPAGTGNLLERSVYPQTLRYAPSQGSHELPTAASGPTAARRFRRMQRPHLRPLHHPRPRSQIRARGCIRTAVAESGREPVARHAHGAGRPRSEHRHPEGDEPDSIRWRA